MQFKRSKPRRSLDTGQSVVPMINVVFLLLIFFMISARIAPAPPFDLILPRSENDRPLADDLTLYIAADGAAGFQGQLMEAAWIALDQLDNDQPLTIRADAELPARKLAVILARLAAMGIGSVELAVQTP